MVTVLSAGNRRRHCVLSTARLPADIRVKKPRDGKNMSTQTGSHRSGGRMQNSPSENPSGQTIQNKDTVDGNLTTSE